MISSPNTSTVGKVYLVGAGPGDPGLLTIRGKELIELADVVAYDALVSPAILEMVNPKAKKIHAGKRRGQHSLMQEEINELLIREAQSHQVVVRLKGGDPFVFGRGGEEMQDLLNANIPVEIVPGITSGIAAPAYAGIPLTHRDFSSSVTFVTGHEKSGKYRPSINWDAIAHGSETLVIYMGVHNLPNIIEKLLAAGRSPETPIALIRWGTRPEQSEIQGTLDTIIDILFEAEFKAPAIAIIGDVIQLKDELMAGCPPGLTFYPESIEAQS